MGWLERHLPLGFCLLPGKGELVREDSVVGLEETEVESWDLRMQMVRRRGKRKTLSFLIWMLGWTVVSSIWKTNIPFCHRVTRRGNVATAGPVGWGSDRIGDLGSHGRETGEGYL